jgi:hypothetical protein
LPLLEEDEEENLSRDSSILRIARNSIAAVALELYSGDRSSTPTEGSNDDDDEEDDDDDKEDDDEEEEGDEVTSRSPSVLAESSLPNDHQPIHRPTKDCSETLSREASSTASF